MSLTLAGCKTSSGDKQLITAAIDARCEAEFVRMVQVRRDSLNKREVINLIVELDKSQKAKGYCGRLLVSNLRAIIGEK